MFTCINRPNMPQLNQANMKRVFAEFLALNKRGKKINKYWRKHETRIQIFLA